MKPFLTWAQGDDGKDWWLRAGDLEVDLVWLSKRKTYWEAVCWLPGATMPRRYGPILAQISDAETLVNWWLEKAMDS